MGASTTASKVLNARNPQFEKADLLDAKFGCQFLHAKHWNVGAGDCGPFLTTWIGQVRFTFRSITRTPPLVPRILRGR